MYFEEDGELVIVDYKTDRVNKSAEGAQKLVKRYAVQLNYYAKALAPVSYTHLTKTQHSRILM